MSPQAKSAVKRWAGIIAVLLPAAGWVLTTSAASVDTRYMHQRSFEAFLQTYEKQRIIDSIERSLISRKIDTLTVRVQQMNCGLKIAEGCR